jgi:hypothetical protein
VGWLVLRIAFVFLFSPLVNNTPTPRFWNFYGLRSVAGIKLPSWERKLHVKTRSECEEGSRGRMLNVEDLLVVGLEGGGHDGKNVRTHALFHESDTMDRRIRHGMAWHGMACPYMTCLEHTRSG